jgi:hypothetical protein
MLKLRLFAAVALVLSLQACGTYSTSSITPAANAQDQAALANHKSPEQILITENDILDKKYTSLGDLSITVRKINIFDSDPTREQVNQALQERAADMGADAVVLVRYGTVGIGAFSWGQMDGNGRAVVFQ